MYKIVIKNTVTNQEYVYDNIEDINGGKKLYYNFNIDTSNLDDGEYKLTLFKGDDIVCTELLKVGDFNSDKIQYSKGANVYIDAKPNKIDVAATGIKFGESTFTEIPDIFDFSNVTDMSHMFYYCDKLTTIPLLDTSNVKNMDGMFYNCFKLTTIPTLDTSNVDNMSEMFSYCYKLTTIPTLDTSNVKNMSEMFYHCQSLQSIPNLNTSNVTDMSEMFSYCYKLTTIPLLECGKITKANYIFGFSNITTLTDLGGFKNLKISVTSNFLDKAPNLTVDSLMNVINNVYDLTANGLSGKSMKFGSTNLNKLTEEQIAVATNKGWTLIA